MQYANNLKTVMPMGKLNGSDKLCNCRVTQQNNQPHKPVNKIVYMIPSLIWSMAIAFFPKCPMCWAAYATLFSTFGIVQLPYMPWLLPIFIALLLGNLFLIQRNASEVGQIPFFISLLGATSIIAGRLACKDPKFMLLTGILLLAIGSLYNSYLQNKSQKLTTK